MSYLLTLWRDAGNVLREHGQLLVIATVVSLALVIGHYRPVRLPGLGPEWRVVSVGVGRSLVLYLGLPLLSLVFLRIPLRELGFSLGRPSQWLVDVALLYAVMVPLLFFVARMPQFARAYPWCKAAQLGVGPFLETQAARLVVMFGWEFLLRGYLLFGFSRKVGSAAIAVQAIPFVVAHVGKPELETYGSVVAGVVLGILALRNRSFLPGVLLHFAVAATLDLAAVLRC